MKPCPFCGNDQALTFCALQDSPDYIHVVCDLNNGGCGCSGTYEQSGDDAIKAWNRRPKNNKSKFEKFCDLIGMEEGKIYTDENGFFVQIDGDEILCNFERDDESDWQRIGCSALLRTELKEYIPIKQPTEKDIEIMKAFKVLYGYKWFACDKDGDVWGFISKPKKEDDEWHPLDCKGCNPTERTLSHISWEDKEPYYFEG